MPAVLMTIIYDQIVPVPTCIKKRIIFFRQKFDYSPFLLVYRISN
jgi:hypothetical protein